MQSFLRAIFNGPAWRTFLLMGVFGALFATSSYNLFQLSRANLAYIAENGTMALMEGGLRQLLELIGYGYLSLGFYVLFKGCLYGLLHRVAPH
jgi:hypothetical protein